MFTAHLSRRELRAALLTGAATATVFAFAGPANAESTAAAAETVVVTGSRIPQTGLTSVSPVSTVSSQEAVFQGTTNVETLINSLPQAFPELTNTQSNGATGQATVNLRGLGAARTLVLVDGRRLMPSDPAFPVPDLNTIPAALVERVEILTGGASAVYGSDAVAGVVNFIMRHDFEGVEFDGQWSINQGSNDDGFLHDIIELATFDQPPRNFWDGQTVDGTVMIGANTDNGRGNVTAWIGYRRQQGVLQSQRDYSACAITARRVSTADHPIPAGVFNTHRCAGSSNKNRWISIDNYYAGLPYDFFEQGTGEPGTGVFTPFGQVGISERTFNFAPFNYTQRPDTRWTAGFFAHYEVEPWLDIYSDFMFHDDRTFGQIAPSGLFLGTGVIYGAFVHVNCDNPLMTAQERATICGAQNIQPNQALLQIGRRNIEGGPRYADLRHTSYRAVLGAKGDLGDGWRYDVYGQYGYTIYSQRYANELSVQRTQNALQVHLVNGVPTCDVVVAGTDRTCVPLDIFNGIGSITPEMLNYVEAEGFQSGYLVEKIVSGSVTGDLGFIGAQSPWAENPAAIALGAEYRSEGLALYTSRDFQINDLYGQGGATLPVPFSEFNVKEVFGEIRIPLIQDAPFAKVLQINGAIRYSDYSSAGRVLSYEYGAEWAPMDDFRLRASYQRAVRAPNILELFTPQNVVLFGGQDPCSGDDPAVLANCASSHPNPGADVPNAGAGILRCPSSQCNQRIGGNEALEPERADTRSIGVVFTPTFIPGFSATVDYFSIKVHGFIGTINPNLTLTQCYTNNNQFFCDLIQRNALNQIFGGGFVDANNQNTGALRTKGWDFEANYQTDLADWDLGNNGSLALNFNGTLLTDYTTQPLPGFDAYDCKGFFGLTCGTPNPKWRHKLRVTWASPIDVDFSVQWRHLSDVDLDIDSTNTLIGGNPEPCPAPFQHLHGECDLVDSHIQAYDYFDIAGVWHVWDNVDLRVGVNNVFDRSPPVLDSNTFGISSPVLGNGNTFPAVYDSLGRFIFVGGTVKL